MENADVLSKGELKRRQRAALELAKMPEYKLKLKAKDAARKLKNKELGIRSERRSKGVKIDSNIRVLVDLSFNSYMTDKEIKSAASQLSFCYSDNNKKPITLNLFASSLSGGLKDVFVKLSPDYLRWKMSIFEKAYTEISNEEWKMEEGQEALELVYLTDNLITELDPKCVYIVGGIVDKNRYKGLCLSKATTQNISHGRLPIGEYIDLATRKILTTNHVVAILSEWVNCKDWEKAFLTVIPSRKLPIKKEAPTCIAEEVEDLDLKDQSEVV